ncbi:E3 ubiquitin-protein ligase TRIM71-like [Mytilus trossulus]|uniref:E3 ubiquitin-protein ligase TRIM71-like n=1 Tax=Mytilus trossulus TaxID=6551 RepID=UPI003007A97E
MAYALRPQSARRAQVQKKCDLCETDTNIQYRCVQCQKYMCEKCNRIHLNVQTSIKHEIISIRPNKDFQENLTNVVTNNIPCDKHKKKEYIKYCIDCIELVCEDCIHKTHREHELEEINKGCDDPIGITKARLSKDLWFCENESNQLQKSTQMCLSSYDNARKKIDIREKEMKGEIEKYANQLRAKIKTKKDNIENRRKTSEKKIKDIRDILNDIESELKKAQKSCRADKIIKAIREINNIFPNLDFHPLPQELSDFMSGGITVSEIFGSLQSTPITNEQHNIDFQVIKSYTTELNSVHRMLTLDNKAAWISSYEMTTLSKVSVDNKIRTVKNISADVNDMSLTASKNILLSLSCSTDVSLLTTKTGEIKPFLSLSPLYPGSIHITKHNEIILGVMEEGGTNDLTDKSFKLIVFGMNGKQKQSFEYDKHKQRMFTLPDRITSNVNDDIVVIDHSTNYNGRVVVLDQEGQVKWTYQGNLQVNLGKDLFYPSDIVTTSVGHVIVSDINGHALHVLSQQGALLICKVMTDQGIIHPMSLDIDIKGQLWVGCISEDGESCDAKLHIVKFSS